MQVKRPFRLLSLALVIAVLATLLPGASAARAQDIDDPVPPCTALEIVGFADSAADSLLTISDITLRFETADTFELLVEFDEFYLDWWTNVQPELPDCALALRYERMMARALGQIYIVLVWSASGSEAMLVGHPELLNATSEEMLEFNDLLVELTERIQQ